jgi:POT family proton-dependent oligopeptide transporter
MGINVGALLAPLVCGTLGQKLGWHYGFGCAGLGMLLALVIYQRGHKHLKPYDALPERAQDTGAQPSSDDVSLPAAADDAMAQTLWRHWRELTALLVLAVFGNIAFWATFEQAGTSLTLFAEQSVDLHVPWLGQDVPSSWFQVANPLFIMVLAPLFSMAWVGLKARAIEPSTPAKFVFGLLAVSAGFTVMVHAGGLADQGVKVSPIWLIMTYFLNTCGEPRDGA